MVMLASGQPNPNQKLDIAGKMKVGDDAATAAEGAIRYNSSTKDLEGYVNGAWKSLTAVSPGGGGGGGAGNIYESCTLTAMGGYGGCEPGYHTVKQFVAGGFRGPAGELESLNCSICAPVENSCASAGGTIVSDGSVSFCKFANLSSCPSGWSHYQNWTTTSANTCTGTESGGCTVNPSSDKTCTTGSHAWGNASVETCAYKRASRLTGYTPGMWCTTGNITICSDHDITGEWLPGGWNPASCDTSAWGYCEIPYDYCATEPVLPPCASTVNTIGCH